MVSRYLKFLLLFALFTNFLSATNVLKKLSVNGNILALGFENSLKKGDFRASATSKNGITKYIFDFKKCYLNRKVKRVKKLNGFVKSIRVAQYKPNVVRVVIDSKKSYKVKYYQKNKPIFYITLPSAIKGKKTAHAEVSRVSPKKLFSNVKNDSSEEVKIVETRYSANLKHSYKIVIDPGHGGKDPGAMAGKIREKDIVLSISKRVYKRLKNLGFRVKMTRYKNRYITLGNRMRKANRDKADLFVSIHANSVKNRARREVVYGIETYFLSQARNARAKRVAARENRSLLKSMDRTTKEVILNTVFTGPKIILSNRLAIDVQKGILNSLRETYRGVKDNGVRGAPFYVLVGAQMPAILIEVGYISNSKERRKLLSPKYQEKMARGIVKGIINYLKIRERELE